MSTAIADESFEALLKFLYETHGSDFTGYKRSSLMRRVQKRLEQLHLASYDEYIDHLEVHPEEHSVLLDTILINVTSFFRDPVAWEHLNKEVIPKLTQAVDGNESIRIWSAGCASGQEAYSIAMCMTEALGPEGFRQRVKIYATDVDEEALNRARQGVYSIKDLEAVPDELRTKYFDTSGQRGAFASDLRRCVIFGRHDLLQDAPISRVDLLLCRNTLMYFNADTQSRVLARLHYAINDGGYLFVGRAEMLLTHASLFTPVDMRHRIFAKVSSPNFRSRMRVLAQGANGAVDHVGRQVMLREAAFDSDGNAVILVDADGVLVMANQHARTSLGIALRDIGRRLADIEASYRPVELRSLIEHARKERRLVHASSIERALPNGAVEVLDIVVTPLSGNDGEDLGVSITFKDVTVTSRLQSDLTKSRQELETAYEELQSTNEELETTNEELQSTVEELETTNEELQSANEELETMNEELQSTNGELQAINSEMQSRSSEIDRLNTFIESVLGSLDAGVIAVDSDLRVVVWNDRSTDLWGLRADEVLGEQFLGLDIGLPVGELGTPLRRCISGEMRQDERTLTALSRRGKTITIRVTCIGVSGARATQGVVVLVEELKPES